MKSHRKKTDPGWRASVPYSRWVFAIAAGASFACLLALITLETVDELAKIAIVCFATAIPLLGQHVLVLADESRGHHSSRLMRVMTVLGLFTFLIGFVAMLARVSISFAVYWSFVTLAILLVLEASQRRAESTRVL